MLYQELVLHVIGGNYEFHPKIKYHSLGEMIMYDLNNKHSLAVMQFPISKLLNVLVLISLLLSNFGKFPTEARGSQKVEVISNPPELSAINNPSFNRPEPRIVNRINQTSGMASAQTITYALECVGGPCSGAPADTKVSEHFVGTGQVGWGGVTLPASYDFRIRYIGIDCNVHFVPLDCSKTQNVYYHSVLVQSFQSTFAPRTVYVSNYGVGGTGGTTSIYCGSGWTFNCTIEAWGVIRTSSVASVRATLQVGTFGSFDWESKDWTVEVSLDPSLIPHLPDDAVLCPNGCGGYSAALNQVGDPINTRTGAMSYPITDISIPTTSGQISFQRTYSSAATSLYTTPLGSGWTHNHDMHLVFPTDPGGLAGILKLKDFSGNFYRFWDVGNGTYVPYSGVTYSLIKNNTTPITY